MTFFRRFSAPLILITLLIAGWTGWENRWAIYDYIRLRDYTPSEQIVQMANDTTMDEETRRLFYVYDPTLLDKETFRTKCSTGEVSIVLGCYISGDRIYLADINDPRLKGIVEVTAAHEVLHVAYERLKPNERERINQLLQQAYEDVENERILRNVDEYRNNGADVVNELHSILPTEIRNLPPELETYYSQYFEDRSKIVALSEQYERAFTELKEQVASYDQQLAGIRSRINSLEQSLAQKEAQLNADRQHLNSLLNSGDTEAYNAAVPGFNALVNSYNQDIAAIRDLINRFNDIVAKRNDIATEQGELIEAIDSRPEPVAQ